MFDFSVLTSGHIFGLPGLSTFFQGLCQLHQANFLWWEADCLWLEADHLEAEGFQQMEFAVVGSGAKGIYDLLQGAITQPDPSVSVGPPLPKRCKWVAFATVSSSTAQDYCLRPHGFKAQGRHVRAGGLLSIHSSVQRVAAIPAEMAPLCINIGDTKQIYCCQVKGCPEGPLTSWDAICFLVYCAHLGNKLTCPSCTHTFFNTDTLQQHGKVANSSGSSDPV